ncbi:AAA family ATPase [Kutzneria sp. CA-103260]|uniref:AAA family ATPase n=1 Tax=Kutzneria sp. CA-103260 TaxID=2802641 RepID=UPI001BAC47C5|nr:AAA family ATPase [Kutzneria sp. CA-103260]QUQ65238.1 AAA domain protein [Kutzneria sp. CA-103260]
MPAHILTGTPGAGKTAVLRLLEAHGHVVVEEAATDVIALDIALGHGDPRLDSTFIDDIVTLQRQRQSSVRAETVFFDRSPVCTLALSRYLGLAPSPLLAQEVDRVLAGGVYESTVFLIRNLGFVRATPARRISFADALVFEQVHEQTYRELGFHLVEVPAGPLTGRVAQIERAIKRNN